MVDSRIRYFLSILLSFVVLIVITYPSSPVLHQFLIIDPITSFLFISFIGFLCIFLLNNRRISLKYQIHVSGSLIATLLTIFILVICFMNTGNTTAIRDFISFTMIGSIIFMLKGDAYIRFYRFFLNLVAFLMLISLFGVFIFLLFPESFPEWRVANLNLNSQNTIVSRQEYGDFDYAFYFYTSVIPLDSTNLSFTRFPLIFIEPTYFAAYMIAPLFLSMNYVKSFKDYLIAALLLIGFLLSSSYLAIILSLGSLLVGYLFIKFKIGSPSALMILFISIPVFFIMFPDIFFLLLSIIPGDKVSEFQYFAINGAFSLPSDPTYFGSNNIETADGIIASATSYGASVVLTRYGIIGASAFLVIFLIYIYRSFKYLYKKELKKTKRITGFVALFCCTCMALKVPQFLLLSSMLTHYYLLNTSKISTL